MKILLTVPILFLSLSTLVVSAFEAGGNYAPCRSNSNCATDRACRSFEVDLDVDDVGNVVSGLLQNIGLGGLSNPFSTLVQSATKPCEDDSDYCVCIPLKEDLIQCSSESDCSDGEDCLEKLCVASVQADAWRDPASCSSDSKCSSDTTCVKFAGSGICSARFKETTSSEKPGSGASNGTQSGNDADGEQDDDDDDDDSEVCIAVKSLRHLQSHQLVYQKHMTARVLCDKHGSCATAGHMVRYRGRAMMMKSYCELVGSCERSITKVNSPRYTRALQIPSESPDLTFTAFAARYATAAEEHVLRTAVHIGL